MFPGSIEETDLSIELKEDMLCNGIENKALMLRVIAKCSNCEFDDLD